MELDPLFTDQRWKILQNLANDKLSPLQLAQKTDTTISNVSQQLKLLEAASIVKKEKIQNRDKGKPRALFSLARDYAYIVSIMDGFVEKRLFDLGSANKAMLKMWFLGDKQLQDEVEEFLALSQGSLSSINVIAVNKKERSIVVVAEQLDKNLTTLFDSVKDISVKKLSRRQFDSLVKSDFTNIVILHSKEDVRV